MAGLFSTFVFTLVIFNAQVNCKLYVHWQSMIELISLYCHAQLKGVSSPEAEMNCPAFRTTRVAVEGLDTKI